ncbi:glycosyltransferase family 4 protein [Neorhodopirellula lusitana]|uniref:glycosyltransferase family 4 protein n=1 Tax=Neorhodopirellula lusitana TaxID=445327 RepID=UPI003850ABC0
MKYHAGVSHSAQTIESAVSMQTQVNARVVFLTHYIPLYQVRVLQEITKSIREFKILLSTPIEPNRDFRPDWSGLDVAVQKTITLRRRWKHRSAGFDDPLFVHVPYDTLSRLKSISPDVVFSHELGARSLAAARYCRRSGAKLVLATFMSEHTEQGRGWMRSRVRRRLISQADAITYNGPSCRDYLLSMGADEKRLFHLPYAADDRNVLAEVPVRDEQAVRNRLLCIGQLSARKGVLPLVQQASEFCRRLDQSFEITFVGDGPLRSALEALAAGQSIEGQAAPDKRLKINVLGNQPAGDLPGLMLQHGAIVAPTLADEWLLVVNEGMHAAMPVIGSVYAQAVTTLVRDNETGWQYDPLCPDQDHASSLSRALDGYFRASDEQLVLMRQTAREAASAYTPRKSADGAIAAIASVVGGSAGSGVGSGL